MLVQCLCHEYLGFAWFADSIMAWSSKVILGLRDLFFFWESVRALYNPFLHGSGRHIGSEVWVSFALGSLDHHLYHYSRHTVTCFDLAFMGWVAHHYHTLLHFYPSLFLHFLLHPFIIRLILFHLLLPSSIVVSLHERHVLWCTSPVVGNCSFGCRIESPYSHGPPIFDITHIEAWHYLLGIWAFVSCRFIHLLP